MGNLDAAFDSIVREHADQGAREATERASRRAALREGAGGEPHWYVAHSGSGRDERAIEILRQENVEHYYPQVREITYKPRDRMSAKQRRSGIPVKEVRERPLFPRYFFLLLDLRAGWWRAALERAGLRGLICDGSETLPCSVLAREIASIRAREINGVVPETVSVRQILYRVGEQVRINEGPFAGFNATVEKLLEEPLAGLDESARIKLLVSLFGRASVVELPLCDIEKL